MTVSEKTLRVLTAASAVAAIGDQGLALTIHMHPDAMREVAADLGMSLEALGSTERLYRVWRLAFARCGVEVILLGSEPEAADDSAQAGGAA